MKTITPTFIVFIALLILPLALFAQAKSITSENYYAALKEAYSKTEKQIRKRVRVEKFYRYGNVTVTITNTTEYLPPDKSRWIHIEEKEGKVFKRFEEITIGNSIYRKEDNDDWVKRKDDRRTVMGVREDSTIEFFSEEAKIGKENFQVMVRKIINHNENSLDEDKIWINKKGLITKETSTTSNNELKIIASTVDTAYDYKIKPPKIEAPIK